MKRLGKKQGKNRLWMNYRSEAAQHFNCAERTIDERLKRNDYDLLLWLNEQAEKKIDQVEQSKILKIELQNKLLKLKESRNG